MADPAIEEESNIIEDNKTANAIASMLWCWKYVNREVVSSGSLGAITSNSVAIERGDFKKVPVGSFLKPGGPTISTKLVTYRYYAYNVSWGGNVVDQVDILASHPKEIPNGYASVERTFDKLIEITERDRILEDYKTKFNNQNLNTYSEESNSDEETDATPVYANISLKYRQRPTKLVTTDSPLLDFSERDVFFLAIKPIQYYIRFGALLEYIEAQLLPKINIKSPNHYQNPPIFEIDYDQYDNFMYSLPNQISLDPKVCIVKNLKFKKISSTVEVFTNLSPFLVEDFNPSTTLKNQAYTMNIYLNFEFILESLNSNTDERGDISVYNFLKVVCDGLNKSLGGINNLEPTIDEETNTVSITDTTPIPGRVKAGSYILQLYGYKGIQSTFVRKVDLKTAITPEYATMITVGATAGGYVKGTEATAFSRWNTGLIDRFKEEYIPGNENSLPEGGLDEAVTNYTTEMLSKVSLCYGFTGNLYGAPPELGGLSEDAIATNLSVGTEYYKYLIASQKALQGGTIGFIPFKIGFTMDGISGIKIYNVLHVDTRFLPKAYGDNLNLIVTGVTHKLSDNDWQTDIEATVMPKTSNLASIVIDPSVVAEQIAKNPPVNNNPVTYSGLGNGPGCPDLPGKLAGAMITSKINNAYGGFVKGNEHYIAKLESAYDNFLTKIRSITIIKNGMNGRALIGDSLRSFTFQKLAYDAWVAGGKIGPALANPCSGYHVAGQAVDLDQGGSYTTLAGVKVKIKDDILSHGLLYKSLYDAGLRRISNEWWHWSIGETNHPINFKFVYHKGSPADYPNAIQY